MKNARASRERNGHSSTEARRQKSEALDFEILRLASPDTEWDFLLRTRLLPIGQKGLEAIIAQSAWKSDEEWLHLETTTGPRTLWNVYRGFQAPRDLKSRLLDGRLLETLRQESLYNFDSKLEPVPALGKILEANLSQNFSSALIGYTNGTPAVANPVTIDWDMACGVISQETQKRDHIAERFPAFFCTKKALRDFLDVQDPTKNGELIGKVLDAAESSATTPEDQDATHWLVQICRKSINRQKLRENGGVKGLSLLRNLSSLPSLLLRIHDAPGDRFAHTSNHAKAAKLLYKVCPNELEVRLRKEFKNGYRRSSSLEVTLVGIDSVREHFGLNAPCPPFSDIGRCARRVILLVASCGRRLSCMFGVLPKGFIDDENPFFILGPTKVKKCAYFRLPVGRLLSPIDVDFIRGWIDSLSVSDRTKTILELAGIDRSLLSGTVDYAKIHNAYADLLRQDFNWSNRPRLHDLRRMGITWLSVRLALARNPDLTIPPFLARIFQTQCSLGTLSKSSGIIPDPKTHSI